MKLILKRISHCLFFPLLLISACTEMYDPARQSDNTPDIETKSGVSSVYYWYHGKMINLTVNTDYVNILLDTTFLQRTDLPSLCKELGVEAKTELDEDGLFKAVLKKEESYFRTVERLKSDERVRKVLPYFERGGNNEPIGTSQIFYVKLKELVPDSLAEGEVVPFEEKEYDLEALFEESKRLRANIVKEVAYMPDWYVLSIEGSEFKTAIEAANQFYETGRFEETDPAFMFNFCPNTVNDPLYSYQWGLKNTANPGYDINVENAWSISTMGASRKVAVVDQRIDPDHYDFVGRFLYGEYDAKQDTVRYNTSLFGGDSHGTHVAGIIGANGNNGFGVAGVAYNTYLLRVYHNLSSSSTISSELAQGISWAWNNEADVINCSWGDQGGQNYSIFHSSILENAIVNAMTYGRYGLGTVVVFASGNYGASGAVIDYPANFDESILTVGSMAKTGVRSTFSGYGSELDVVAPGEEIWSTWPGQGFNSESGTSMSAAHVSGMVALMLSVNSYLTREEIVRIIQQTAKRISPGSVYSYSPRNSSFSDETWNQQVGCGLVDAGKAVSIASALATPASTIFDPGVNVYYPVGLNIDQHEGTIQVGYSSQTLWASLLPANINSSYTYYWYVSAPAHPYWHPTFSYILGPDVVINVPNPGSNSTMYIRCLVFNGATLVATPSYTLHVNP